MICFVYLFFIFYFLFFFGWGFFRFCFLDLFHFLHFSPFFFFACVSFHFPFFCLCKVLHIRAGRALHGFSVKRKENASERHGRSRHQRPTLRTSLFGFRAVCATGVSESRSQRDLRGAQ